MYRAGMRSIFSELLRQERLLVVDDLSASKPSTKELLSKFDELGFQKGLIITGSLDVNLYLSARNIPNVYVCEARSLSPVELIHSQKVILTKQAMEVIEENLA
jgi:large subunit ribosomal protein L4